MSITNLPPPSPSSLLPPPTPNPQNVPSELTHIQNDPNTYLNDPSFMAQLATDLNALQGNAAFEVPPTFVGTLLCHWFSEGCIRVGDTTLALQQALVPPAGLSVNLSAFMGALVNDGSSLTALNQIVAAFLGPHGDHAPIIKSQVDPVAMVQYEMSYFMSPPPPLTSSSLTSSTSLYHLLLNDFSNLLETVFPPPSETPPPYAEPLIQFLGRPVGGLSFQAAAASGNVFVYLEAFAKDEPAQTDFNTAVTTYLNGEGS